MLSDTEAPLTTGKATAARTVVVPMAIQAFVVAEDFQDSMYQMAPLIQPDMSKLKPEAGEVMHDLMDQLDTSFWRLQARYNPRFVDLIVGGPKKNRVGIYLSWCLPKMYRAGITATDSTRATEEGNKAYQERRLRSGYSTRNDKHGNASPDASSPSQTQQNRADVEFRPVPDRWIIGRMVHSESSSITWTLLESNCIRALDDDELVMSASPQDLQSTTSPVMDVNAPIESQYKLLMGRSGPLDVQRQTKSRGIYKKPFNAFELGHEFFTDYQPHNMGVFSFFDDLAGLDDVVVDYMIMGYHADPDEDPLFLSRQPVDGESPVLNSELLDALSLLVDRRIPDGIAFLDAKADVTSRTLTHGLLRNLDFNRKSCKLEAPSVALQMAMYKHQPVAVGLHTMDALAAYLYVSLEEADDNTQEGLHVTSRLINQLLMLTAREDDVDSQRKAADEVASYGWIGQAEGTHWQLPKNEDEGRTQSANHTTKPILDEQKTALLKLNDKQTSLDACTREMRQILQRLFGCWWNALGLKKITPEVHKDRREKIKATAVELSARFGRLYTLTNALKSQVTAHKEALEASLVGPGRKRLVAIPAVEYGYFQDPSVVVVGAKSGWPAGFSDKLSVRLASEIAPALDSEIKWPVVGDMQEGFESLAREFKETNVEKRLGWKENPYAAIEDSQGLQGWFPLFLEWEVEYYHVPFKHWLFEPDETTGRWRYTISPKNELSIAIETPDCRRIGGRTSFIPEPAHILCTRLKQLLTQRSTGDDVLATAKAEEILDKIADLEYFSAPLSGLADHLLTLRRGHNPRPIPTDKDTREALGGLPDIIMELLQKESAHELAPYGSTTPLDPDYTAFSPFKPMIHGQARFTKFAIVDKFGQVVSGIKPGDEDFEPVTEPSALYPCISPSLTCGVLEGSTDEYWPNSAVKVDHKANLCQFFQIPPRINQAARLNAAFLIPSSSSDGAEHRHSASEWDNPIWAWLVANFQSHSIQLYNGDGEFVQEILLQPPSTAEEKGTVKLSIGPRAQGHVAMPTGRLIPLLREMSKFTFSNHLFDLLAGATDSGVLSNSVGVSEMPPAVFGRPFYIADVGVSIELAAPPLADASLLTAPPTARFAEPNLVDYELPIGLGNHTAAFDGLVGTFTARGTEIDIVYSAYSKAADAKYQDATERPQLLSVKPYFIAGDVPDSKAKHDAQLSLACVSVIAQPKCPIHIYSGSLFPMKEVSLPPWPTDVAMRTMQAFFYMGPYLVPEKPRGDLFHADISPHLAMSERVTATGERAEGEQQPPTSSPADPSIQLPLVGSQTGKWRWMQPRMDSGNTTWDPVSIRPVDTKLKVEAAAQSQIINGYVLVQPRTD
ncbi:hypothetical protein FNAPI_10412 [Fusarium napiforme]|uniref:Uncharacterized protein n=1 Tax=Fusarium napiforme TaxID=42672 RepID=A0A8H5MSM2_9HYPO|nr:hypothetical protein FNAPI_10412 [Fusarium napiforme]